MALTELARDDVLDAIGECRVMGQQAFLEHYGYGPAAEYLLEYEGGYYDSKAIVGAAHQRVTGQRLEHLSGGLSQTAPFLKRLGFTVTRRSEGLSVAGNNVTSMSSNGVWWVNQSESFDRAAADIYGRQHVPPTTEPAPIGKQP